MKSRLAAAPDVAASRVNVDSDDGVVTLRGHMKSRHEAGRAVQIALDTRGCEKVVSRLSW